MEQQKIIRLGLGGGCHWCTEAIFSSLIGIKHVLQGWLASAAPADTLSEGILLDIDTNVISLEDIIDIHLETHSSQSKHSMRDKYRSAIYYTNEKDKDLVSSILLVSNKPNLVTEVLPLIDFKEQDNEHYKDYFYKQPDKPFCTSHIQPKLKSLLKTHHKFLDKDALKIL